jgi:hypothetical protein
MSLRKVILSLSLMTLVLAFAGQALAQCPMMSGDGDGKSGMQGMQHGSMGGQGGMGLLMWTADTPEEQKFLDETKDLRKKLAQDLAELHAQMAAATPDAKRVRELTGSIFDGKTELMVKAKAAGIAFKRFGMHHWVESGDDQSGHGAHGATQGATDDKGADKPAPAQHQQHGAQ